MAERPPVLPAGLEPDLVLGAMELKSSQLEDVAFIFDRRGIPFCVVSVSVLKCKVKARA